MTATATAGLPHESMARFKLFTLDHRMVPGADDEHAVEAAIRMLLGQQVPTPIIPADPMATPAGRPTSSASPVEGA